MKTKNSHQLPVESSHIASFHQRSKRRLTGRQSSAFVLHLPFREEKERHRQAVFYLPLTPFLQREKRASPAGSLLFASYTFPSERKKKNSQQQPSSFFIAPSFYRRKKKKRHHIQSSAFVLQFRCRQRLSLIHI